MNLAERSRERITQTMSLNHIVLEFPETRPVFERLRISLPMEGCVSLDEVAWRHGLWPTDLLEALEEEVRRGVPVG